jgi:hypothetical protein|tara:strand:- start:2266 stop:2646 length:381 start_codon:yes stop_codon:yes gene_type:complete
MADDQKAEDGFFIKFCKLIRDTFLSLGAKIKLIITGIAGLLGLFFFFFVKNKINEKEILKLELQKIRKELEIAKNQSEIDANNKLIEGLENREAEIRSEIKSILSKEKGKDITLDELDEFFDSRGF